MQAVAIMVSAWRTEFLASRSRSTGECVNRGETFADSLGSFHGVGFGDGVHVEACQCGPFCAAELTCQMVAPSYAGLRVNGSADGIVKMRWVRVCCWLEWVIRVFHAMFNGFGEQVAEGVGVLG